MNSNQQNQLLETLKIIRDKMRLKHLSLATEQCYCGHIRSYIEWLCMHGADMPDTRGRIEAFLSRMALRGCSASTQNQAFNALLFLYEVGRGEKLPENIRTLRAKRPAHVRTALSEEQTRALMAAVPEWWSGYQVGLVVRLLYGCGLRVSEPLNLRVKDLHFDQRQMVIRGAKGGKDRVVRIPDCLVEPLRAQLKAARAVFDEDQRRGVPLAMPVQLDRKYPRAPFSWQWAWLFPSQRPCEHPRTGEMVRYRMHEANVQRAVKHAAMALGLESLATPHVLRHCWATHVLARGENIRSVQAALGHQSLETTMVYVHGDGGSVRSPLDVALPPNVIPFAKAA